MKRRGQIRVAVRSGGGGPNGQTKVRIVTLHRGTRPLLWIGAGEHKGLAWVSGTETLRKIRAALGEALGEESDYCTVHGDVQHGGEAEELRAGIERLMATQTVDDEDGEPAVRASDLQRLLDRVDARDSLAFVEAKARRRTRPETATNETTKEKSK